MNFLCTLPFHCRPSVIDSATYLHLLVVGHSTYSSIASSRDGTVNEIRAQSTSQSSFWRPDPSHGKRTSSNWWAPLFGWSSEPDYVNNSNAADAPQKKLDILAPEPKQGRQRSRFTLGCFMEEKAKRMRRKDMESTSFHDITYHSAIASCLASDVSDRPEK